MQKNINWQTTINETYQEFVHQTLNYAPQLIGAIALLICGYLVASLLRMLTHKAVRGFDTLFKRATTNSNLEAEKLKHSYSLILGRIVFWLVLIFFVAASANLLGWKLFSDLMNQLIAFLPRLVTGLGIILVGYFISNLARSGMLKTGISAANLPVSALARSTQFIILFSFIVIGLEQIGLNVQFLTSIILVVLGITLAGAALAFSFGAKTMVANIIGAQQIRKHCHIGDYLQIGEFTGDILEVTQTAIILSTNNGRAIVPAKYFHEQTLLLNAEKISNDN